MPKQDLKQVHRSYFTAPWTEPAILELPEFRYLMAEGKGHPQAAEFQETVGAMYATAFAAKFMVKKADPENDYVVPPLEVRWHVDRQKKGNGRYGWKMMMMLPSHVDESTVDRATLEARERTARKSKPVAGFERIRYDRLKEGLCAQILHVGPYEGPMERTFRLLKQSLAAQGYSFESESHDIYFNFPPRTPPEKLKTLIRVRILQKPS